MTWASVATLERGTVFMALERAHKTWDIVLLNVAAIDGAPRDTRRE
jgi:hypothetical protein